jgi:hypothetical protein
MVLSWAYFFGVVLSVGRGRADAVVGMWAHVAGIRGSRARSRWIALLGNLA